MPEEKTKVTKYISKFLQLKLINKASYTKEVDGRVVTVEGSSIQFENGLFTTSDPNEIKFLDNHPNCGNAFVKVAAKDLEKAKEESAKTLTEKQQEEKAEKEEKEKEEKKLEEGEKKADEGTDYSEMTVKELKKIAEEKGIEVAKKAKRDDIIEALSGNEEGGEKPAFE